MFHDYVCFTYVSRFPIVNQFFSFSSNKIASSLCMERFSKYMSFKIEILLIPLLQAINHIFEISEDDHPLKIVGHARDH